MEILRGPGESHAQGGGGRQISLGGHREPPATWNVVHLPLVVDMHLPGGLVSDSSEIHQVVTGHVSSGQCLRVEENCWQFVLSSLSVGSSYDGTEWNVRQFLLSE